MNLQSGALRFNRVMTYLTLHLIANKALQLVYENVSECSTILKYKKKIKKFPVRELRLLP